MKNKLHLIFMAVVCMLLLGTKSYSQAPCPTTGCTANDFVSIGYKLADINGNPLNLTGYSLGDPVTAYLWADFQGNAGRYKLFYYFKLLQDGIQTAEISGCYDSNLPDDEIPVGLWVNLHPVTWNYGEELILRDLYLGWQTNKNAPCGCGNNAKCFAAPADIIVEAPLVARFDFTETCQEEGLQIEKFYFTDTSTGGQMPYVYSWTFPGGTPATSTLADPVVTWTTTGTKTVTLVVTDNLGNSSTATASVTVDYCCDLVITAPDDVAIECDESTLPANTGTAVATNNGTPVTPTYSDVISGGMEDNEYVITRTWSATDVCGNTLTDVQVITVTDDTPPVITCPVAVNAGTDANCEYAGPIGTATATDNCDTEVAITHLPAGPYPVGVTNVIWTATDNAGNTATCLQVITITDYDAPVITCPPAVTDIANASCLFTGSIGTATATDNCDATPTITHTPAGPYPLGVTVVTWTATDDAGNSAQCTQSITITDGTPPNITCPAPLTVGTNTGCTYVGGIGTATATDNCDASLTIANNAPSAFPLGVTVVIWTATDDAGHSAQCSQTVTVADDDPPVVTCPANQLFEPNEGLTYVGSIGTATATDNCDASVTVTNNAPSAFPLGVTVVTWTATDDAGNSAICSHTVTVEDNTPVVIDECAAVAEMIANDDCEVLVPDFIAELEALLPDDGNIYTVTQDPEEGTVLTGVGLHLVIMTVTDQSGNSSTCETGVLLLDVTPPVVTCPEDETLSAGATCEAAVPDYITELVVSDNCTESTDLLITQDPEPGTLLGLGEHTVTITVTDLLDNPSYCTFTVTVEDNSDPVISECIEDMTLESEEECEVAMPDVTGDIVVSENCNGDLGTYTITQSPVAGTMLAIGDHTVTVTVTDEAGNSAECSAVITVADKTPPVITCPADITRGTNVDCTFIGSIGSATATDNCDAEVTITNDAPAAFPLGETVVTWVAEDAAGNTAFCTQLVTVYDNDPPYFINCPEDLEAESNDLHKYEIPDYLEMLELEISVGDNCGTLEDPGVTLVQTPEPGTIVNEGSHTITLTATDDAGNTAICQFVLTVKDLTPANFDECPPFKNVEAFVCFDVCTAIIPDFMKEAVVSGGVVSLVQDPAPGTWVEGPGLHLVTLTATDQAGNTSECITGIFVYSVIIEGCEPTTLEIEEGCEAIVPDLVTEKISLFALCGMDSEELGEANLHIVQEPEAGEELGVGSHILTYTVLDEFDHVITTCSTTLTVVDTEEPVVDCPDVPYVIDLKAEVVVNRYGVWIVYKGYLPTNLATATDNCTAPSKLTFHYSQTVFTQMNLGWNWVTVTATDASGNVGSCQMQVLVRYEMTMKNGDTESLTSMEEMNRIPLTTNVYPNPTKGKVWLSIVNLNDPRVTATIYNSAGTVVFNRQYNTEGLIEIDLSDKVSGLYMMRVVADNKEFLHKIILESR